MIICKYKNFVLDPMVRLGQRLDKKSFSQKSSYIWKQWTSLDDFFVLESKATFVFKFFLWGLRWAFGHVEMMYFLTKILFFQCFWCCIRHNPFYVLLTSTNFDQDGFITQWRIYPPWNHLIKKLHISSWNRRWVSIFLWGIQSYVCCNYSPLHLFTLS